MCCLRWGTVLWERSRDRGIGVNKARRVRIFRLSPSLFSTTIDMDPTHNPGLLLSHSAAVENMRRALRMKNDAVASGAFTERRRAGWCRQFEGYAVSLI